MLYKLDNVFDLLETFRFFTNTLYISIINQQKNKKVNIKAIVGTLFS